MIPDGAVFLAANTARSNAYAQALEARGMRVAHTLLLERSGSGTTGGQGLHHGNGAADGIGMPDLRRPLAEVCAGVSGGVERLICTGVKDSQVAEILPALAGRLVIYSGFGGEIVPAELLRACPPFLHMHAGWLPDYRGSTTLYYGLLNEGRCGVSAILLEPEIDRGPIVARRRYGAPPPGLDVDYLYDNAIRADLLVRVLEDWARTGKFANAQPQDPSSGRVYYVIHPVLKHLVLLGLERGTIEPAGSDAG